jgi:WD40 repeat protein
VDTTDEKKRIEIFCCYAHEDQSLLVDLKKHLKLWERQGLLTLWTDTDITAGTNWEKEIVLHLNTAHIILFLVSPDFLVSEYCYGTEMRYAMERYDRGEVRVIPIILRHCSWQEAPFGKIQALPAHAEPVVGWHDQDEAFTDVARGIRNVVEALTQSSQQRDIQDFLTESQPVKEGLSRRAVVLGLVALGIAAAGVGGWALVTSSHWHIPLMPTILSATPTLLPGTTLLTYTGHLYYIWSVAWSPDGTHIASGSVDQTVQVWDAMSGKKVFIYHGHTGAQYGVFTVAWSLDGKRIASGAGDRTVQVWDAFTGDHVLTYRGHSTTIHKVAWSPDGKRIASGSFDKTVQVWDASTSDHILTYKGHSDTVYWVAWSPDGKRIVSGSGSQDKTVQVWDASTGRNVLTYRGHSYGVAAVAWSPDGKRIASGDAYTVQVWDASTSGNAFTYWGHSNVVHSVAWSPNGKRIASASFDRTVQVWDASTGGNVLTYRGHSSSVFEAAWSPDGRRIASGSLDNTVQVWSAG